MQWERNYLLGSLRVLFINSGAGTSYPKDGRLEFLEFNIYIQRSH